MTRMITPLVLGAAGAVAARSAVRAALLAKFRRDVSNLNRGDARPLLSAYAEDAVLRFNPGEHRWAGDHVGKPAIERFLRDFTNARIRGEILDLWFGGPLWALTLVARFDDRAVGPDGERLYANRTCLVVRTRWGRIIEQHDFYEDTGRILAFEKRLNELGVEPVAA